MTPISLWIDGLGYPTTGKSAWRCRAALQSRAEACGSQSIRMTLLPRTTNSPATFVARVVFPTPPFWLRKAIAITEILKNGNLYFCKSFFTDYQPLPGHLGQMPAERSPG